MRGKPLISHLGKHAKRITPADAGKTVCTTTHTPVQWDHPRRCGENIATVCPARQNTRITPAGAGKTIRRYTVVHRSPGSPPQVRGKRSCKVFQQSDAGITPAGAGKTGVRNGLCTGRQDHPRRCGENFRVQPLFGNAVGSPPQVRGKQLNRLTIKRRDRITPAGAGKTDLCGCKFCATWDHPRRCGENLVILPDYQGIGGSPPQVRGKPLSPQKTPPNSRITPAGAGKTCIFRQTLLK